MKPINKLIVIAVLTFTLISCRDEDAVRMPQLKTAANMRVTIDPAKAIIDFQNISDATFEFDAHSLNKDLGKVEFFVAFTDASEDSTYTSRVAKMLIQSDFKGGKAHVVLASAELAQLFGFTGANALGGGDVFDFKTVVTLKDGRTFSEENAAPSITANPLTAPGAFPGGGSSFTTRFNTFVGCASDLPVVGRKYKSKISITTACCGLPTGPNVKSGTDITITPLGNAQYEISDLLAGWLKGFDIDPEPAVILDICGTYSVKKSPNGALEYSSPTPVTFNETTGVWIIPWKNSENGLEGVTVLTPQ